MIWHSLDMVHQSDDSVGGETAPAFWAIEAFDQLADFVTVLDAVGTMVYVNPFAERMLGVESGSAQGRSIADFLHPDDLVRALHVMAMMVDRSMDVPVTPAVYRVAMIDGGWCPVEMNASVFRSVPGPDLVGLSGQVVIIGRYSGDRDLQDRIMERLVAGDSATDVVDLIPEVGQWRHPSDHYAVFFSGDDGDHRSTGSTLACALDDQAERGSPWNQAATSGDEVIATLADLPPGLRAAAEAAGLVGCWAIPVEDPLFSRPAVIVAWSRADGSIMEVHRYALETMARLLALVLQWRQQVTSLRGAARRDPLTGLANRTRFWELLETMNAGKDEPRVGVLYVDLDGFKAVNDAHGHQVGDRVLAEVAQRISAVLRPGDVVARLGGDEFAVLCPNLGDDASATAIAQRVVVALERPFAVGDVAVEIGASVGIAMARPGDLGADELIDAADRALYRAKDEGRGRWHLGSEPSGRS